MRINRFK